MVYKTTILQKLDVNKRWKEQKSTACTLPFPNSRCTEKISVSYKYRCTYERRNSYRPGNI